MSTDPCSELPDERNWSFEQILAAEPQRAAVRTMAEPPSMLLAAIQEEFAAAVAADDVRFGHEQSCSAPQDLRAVVQFAVTPELFDKFFNARTGCRAHFRAYYECGLKSNGEIIDALRRELEATLPTIVDGRQLGCRFEDCGPARIARDFLLTSFVPSLSKIWFCARLIESAGGIRDLPSGVVGDRILLAGGESWAAPCREQGKAWLAVKGAFLGTSGPYQPKGPVSRAKALQDTGRT